MQIQIHCKFVSIRRPEMFGIKMSESLPQNLEGTVMVRFFILFFFEFKKMLQKTK